MLTRHRPSTLLIASLALTLGGALGGCWPGYRPGGSEASRDLYTYESTPDFPQNIVVIDWTTNEQLLTVEVPVGQQLVMRFFEDYNDNNPTRPALMRWKLMPRGTEFGELDNTMPVPAYTHRRVDVYVRGRAEALPKPAPLPGPEPVNPVK